MKTSICLSAAAGLGWDFSTIFLTQGSEFHTFSVSGEFALSKNIVQGE